MSLNVANICRICLSTFINNKQFNLFFSAGRPAQIWTKIMACAWVQVFEGDGLPNHICCKCHDSLEKAYQFKQQCETSDAQLRQYLSRNITNKNTSLDLVHDYREGQLDFKPFSLSVGNDSMDLTQAELSLNSLRLFNQEMPCLTSADMKICESVARTKEEPECQRNDFPVDHALAALDRHNEEFSISTSLIETRENELCANGENILNNIQAKLLEAVAESFSNSFSNELHDSRMVAWDLQNKQSFPLPVEKPNNENTPITIQKTVADFPTSAKENTLLYIDETKPLVINKDICSQFDKQKDNQNHDPVIMESSVTNKEVNNVRPSTGKPEIPNKKVTGKTKKAKSQEQCELCGKVFRYRGYMQLHMRTHTHERPFSCKYCKQTFTMHHSFVSHQRVHTGDKPYICAECGKGFTQSSGLKSHMRLHSGEKPYQCEVCSKKFTQSSNLISHKLIHSGRRDFHCKICNKAFKFQKHLLSHQKTHTDQKEFKCSLCPKRFNRKSYLKTHLFTHSGDKPFKCHICPTAFTSSSNLQAHMRKHTGLKPYECQICKKSFSQSNALTRHMKQHRSL